MKIIKIENCWKCPYCDKKNCFCEEKVEIIPFSSIISIPSWCPLENFEENQEKTGMYEEFTGKKIMETFKREAIKGDK